MDLSTINDIKINMGFQSKSCKQVLDLIKDLKEKGEIEDAEELETYCRGILNAAEKAEDLARLAEPYYKKEPKKEDKPKKKPKKEEPEDIVVDDDDDDDMSFLE